MVLDAALTIAGEVLRPLLKRYSPNEVEIAFAQHCETHLLTELGNIKRHGHRMDDPNDKPKRGRKVAKTPKLEVKP